MPRPRRCAACRTLRPGLLRLWHRLSRRAPGRASLADRLGRRGERVAAKALRRAGCRILARRLMTQAGEIDVVALDGDTLVLVEVKASLRRDAAGVVLVRPSDRVDHTKRNRLVGASRLLRRGTLAGRPYRIDVVSVVFEGRRSIVTIIRGAVLTSRER